MLAAVFYGPRDIRLEDVEEPHAGNGELIIRVLASNMCGTDLKTYIRGHPLMKAPMIIGHEFCGEVIEVGEGVDRFKRGDRVVASNSAPCMQCTMCRLGSLTLCEGIRESLIGFTLPGSYASYLKIPSAIVDRNTYLIKSSIEPREIACAEPLASVIHAIDKVRIREGDRVAVIGSGALGLMFLQLLKSMNAYVIMTNRSGERVKLAERLGADAAIQVTDENLANKIREATDGIGADLVIEAVGRKETWESAFKAVRKGGQVLLFGGCSAGTTVSFDAEKIHYGETQIIGSFHHEPSAFRRAIEAIESKVVNVKPLLTHNLSINDILLGFRLMEKREAMKVSIIP